MAKKSSANAGNTTEIVRRLALPIIEECGVLLWDVRFVKEGADWFLRVFIDHAERAVSIDDCVQVSRKLSDALDVADPIQQSYCLEVSSPGIERELTRPEHFALFEGYPVAVRLYQACENVKEFEGILLGMQDNVLQLEDSNETILTFDKKEIVSVHVLDYEENET